MKYLERIGIINTVAGIVVAVVPYTLAIIFKWDELVKTALEQILLVASTFLILIITILLTLEGKKIAKIAGFAYGYFYNFIYEIADLIDDNDANIEVNKNLVKTAKDDKIAGQSYSNEYSDSEIKLLIILPCDVHAQYRFSELLTAIFDEAMIFPAKNGYFYMRNKFMKAIEINLNGKKQLVLIDTPPTTMRAVKLYRESLCGIDHNDPFDRLDKKKKERFNDVCKFCTKNVMPIFKSELESIIKKISKSSNSTDYIDMIRIIPLEDIIDGIIDNREFESLKLIGDNKFPNSLQVKANVSSIINSKKSDILKKITTIMSI